MYHSPAHIKLTYQDILISASQHTLDIPMTTLTPLKNALKKVTNVIRRSWTFSLDNSSNHDSVDTSTGDVSVLSQATLNSRYEAESPDELALVKAVCGYGCRLLDRTNDSVSVYLPPNGKTTYKVCLLAAAVVLHAPVTVTLDTV